MAKLYKVSNHPGLYCFDCPGCGFLHQIADKNYQGPGHKWDFNGNLDKPTFAPSYLLWSDHPETKKRMLTCHSYIREGQIQFLSDCTHSYAGKTYDMPDVEGER